jgi:hypothetical protein
MSLYEFVYRGLLTEAALDAAGRASRQVPDWNFSEIAEALNLDVLESDYVVPAERMALVYTSIAAFENSVRRFIYKVLNDTYGDDWWTLGVSQKIRKFAEDRRAEEQKTKWHGARGEALLSFTEMGHLVNIMQQNWDAFEPYVRRIDWATAIFSAIERSRNVIMHSGELDLEDIERVGMNMRDWIKQVNQ